MKYFISVVLFSIFYFLFSMSASADTVCQPVYGGGLSCVQTGNILINKTILNPKDNTYVDNLGVNDVKYGQDQTVTFQLTISNTGDATISRIIVKDIFPQFVVFVSGPGSFDTKTKVLTFEISDLKTNESRNYKVTGKVVSYNELPNDQNITCVINQATAALPDNKQASQDNAQFCIQKEIAVEQIPTTTKGGLKVFPPSQVTTTPPTGPEMLPLIGLIPSGVLGWFLRRKSGKN